MTIDVVTVFAPRAAGWEEYLPLLALQRDTVHHFGHRHFVVTDAPLLNGFRTVQVTLPANLMQAQLAGQIAWLEGAPQESGVEHWEDGNTVLVDADCLVGRDLTRAFTGDFDLALTHRESQVSPVNNGAMYVAAGSRARVLPFFRGALEGCEPHWGGDQEAISRAAAPVPDLIDLDQYPILQRRGDLRLAFYNMRTHNCTPRIPTGGRKGNPFVIHFKGAERKTWMPEYAERYILRRPS